MKIGGKWLGGILLLIVLLLLLLRTSTVQTFLTKRVVAYFSTELNTTVSLNRIDIDFFKTVVFEGLLIKDLDDDTLLYAGRFGLDLKVLQRDDRVIALNSLNLEDAYFNLTTWADSAGANYDFITQYFNPPSDEIDTTDLPSWRIEADRIKLVNAHFKYNDKGALNASHGVDFSHIDATNVYGTFDQLRVEEDTIFSQVEGLRFEEKSGFVLHNLSGDAKVHSSVTQVNNLRIETPLSNVNADLSFKMEDFKSYNSFIEAVRMNVTFDETVAAFEDIAYFASSLKGIKEKVFLQGDISGTVANLKGRDVVIHLLSDTYLRGDFDLRGLPEIDETFIYMKIRSLQTNKASLERLPLYPFDANVLLSVPKEFESLGRMDFSGSFTGFITDFVAYGELQTEVGKLITDVSFKDENGTPAYTGKIALSQFDIGKTFGISKQVQKTTLNANISGTGLDLVSIDLSVDGKIASIGLEGYVYKNIDLKGLYKNQLFDGIASVEDENIDFDFNGKVDLAGTLPIFNFKANINKAKLSQLKLINSVDTSVVVSATADINLIGDKLDNLDGAIQLTDIFYRDSSHTIFTKNISLDAHQFNDTLRTLAIRSDIADINMNGNFNFDDLLPSLANFSTAYIPSARYIYAPQLNAENFTFDVLLKNTSILTKVFMPSLQIGRLSRINGNYNSERQEINFYGTAPLISYNDIHFHNINIQGESPNEILVLDASINQLELSDSLSIENLKLQVLSANDSVTTQIKWLNQSQKGYAADLLLYTTFNGFSNSEHHFENSTFLIHDSLWTINNNNRISIDSSAIAIKNLIISSTKEELAVNGKVSEHDKDTLSVQFKEMSLTYLQPFIPPSALSIQGYVSGQFTIINAYRQAIVNAGINMHNLTVNDFEIGDGWLKSTYNITDNVVLADGAFGNRSNPLLTVSGNYYPQQVDNNVSIDAAFHDAPLSIFEQYCSDYLSQISGTYNGHVFVSGDIKLPQLKGRLMLDKASFMVDYLNTTYSINDEIIIEPDFFGFNLIEIVDENGNPAIATGTAFHENYENFSLDIGLELDQFLALNTTAKDNELYYGTANVSGLANISGYANNLIFDLNVTTEKNTRLNIPLTDGSEVYSSNFLTFVEKNSVYKQNTNYEVDLDGIDMNFDLTVTPEAEVRLIFDEQVGDVIKGRGEGNIKMEINTLGDFEIFGNYIIQEGDYLFTLQNLINKKFILQKGGQITWNGDPFEANMKLSADYKLRSSLYDILPDDTLGRYRRRVPVVLGLNMKGKLMNPDISFDIDLPTADDETNQRLQSILYVNSSEVNKQEMNKQVFSLLILNRFAPVSGLNQQYEHANVGATSSSEFLSNQLSSWLSRISDDVNIGVNYRPGDELSSDEYEVALSTQFFNDRVIVDGNVGYSSNNYQYENNQSTSGLIGEFSVEYKISKDGRFRLRGFNRSNNNSLLQINSPYTQGAGLFYREEFSSFGELFQKYKRTLFTRKEE